MLGWKASDGGFLGWGRHSCCLLGALCLDKQGMQTVHSKENGMTVGSCKGSLEEGTENWERQAKACPAQGGTDSTNQSFKTTSDFCPTFATVYFEKNVLIKNYIHGAFS